MTLAVYRGDGKREGGHSIPRRQVPNPGVRFSGLVTHGETAGFRPPAALGGNGPAKSETTAFPPLADQMLWLPGAL
jgi:hypothetical protein